MEESTPFVESTASSSERNAPSEKTQKTARLVYWVFVLHGIGTLMPWNMFLTIAPTVSTASWSLTPPL